MPDKESRMSLVAAGIGVGLIPRSVQYMYAELIQIVPRGPDAPNSGVYVVQRRQENSSVIGAFVRMITDSAQGTKFERASFKIATTNQSALLRLDLKYLRTNESV
jgi:DNA-binding transcriptional LysR family regulator